MELNDIAKLKIGTQVKTCLNNSLATGEWFYGNLKREPSFKNANFIQIYMNRDNYSPFWGVQVTQKNKQYFKLANPEWDEESND